MKIVIILILLLATGFSLLLRYLSYSRRNAPIPKNVTDVYDEDTYKKQMAYRMEKLGFSIVEVFIGLVFTLVFLLFNIHYMIYDCIGIENVYLMSLVLFGIVYAMSFVIDVITNIYDTFKIETKHGFNTTSVKTFVLDCIKGFIINMIISSGMICLFILLHGWLGNMMFPIFYLIIVVIVAIIFFLSPFFMKIFNKFTDLEDGELKIKIQEFINITGYTINRIKVMDGSKRSKKGQAMVTGMGKTKTIILYDTILTKYTTDEIVAVLAHELGHAKYKHVQLSLVMTLFSIAIFVAGAYFVIAQPTIAQAFGFEYANVVFGFFVLGIFLSPINTIVKIPMMAIARRFEYTADKFAAENFSAPAIVNALKRLARENFGNLTPHQFVVACEYTHPPIDKRIAALGDDFEPLPFDKIDDDEK